jgi:hypothetical protein
MKWKELKKKAFVSAIDKTIKIVIISAAIQYIVQGQYAIGALGLAIGFGLIVWNEVTQT